MAGGRRQRRSRSPGRDGRTGTPVVGTISVAVRRLQARCPPASAWGPSAVREYPDAFGFLALRTDQLGDVALAIQPPFESALATGPTAAGDTQLYHYVIQINFMLMMILIFGWVFGQPPGVPGASGEWARYASVGSGVDAVWIERRCGVTQPTARRVNERVVERTGGRTNGRPIAVDGVDGEICSRYGAWGARTGTLQPDRTHYSTAPSTPISTRNPLGRRCHETAGNPLASNRAIARRATGFCSRCWFCRSMEGPETIGPMSTVERSNGTPTCGRRP